MKGSRSLAAIVALTALAACVREGPPAPLSFPGAHARSSMPPPAMVREEHPPHPNQVVVAKGETLYAISRRYDVPLRSIIDANHLDPPFHVAAGTKLLLPQVRFHVVRTGDTLYRIARLYGVDLSTLVRLNGLRPPYTLVTGETLYLPASVEPEEAAPVAMARAAPRAPSPKPEAPSSFASLSAPPPKKPAHAAPVRQAKATPRRPPARTSAGFEWPLEGRIIEGYGSGPNGTHNDGINIAAREGEPVRAADAGVVAYAGNELRGYGDLILIKHAGGYMTAYAHNSRLLVRRGEVVRRGQEIARAGETGAVNSPQLHFEIRRGTQALDPLRLLPNLRASAR